MSRPRTIVSLLSVLLAASPLPALAQSYRVLDVAPLPGHQIAELTDLNDRLVGVGFSRYPARPIVWDRDGTRLIDAVEPTNLGPLKINNAGIIVTTGHWRYVGGVSFRNDWLAIVNNVEYTLPSPAGESYAEQLSDSGIVLMSVRQQGSWWLRGGQLHSSSAFGSVTSFTEDGIGVGRFPDLTTTPVTWNAVAYLPGGGRFRLWDNPGLAPIYVGPTGYIVQQRILSSESDDFFVRAPDGHIRIAAVPSGRHVSVKPPNAAGDIVGIMWPHGGAPGESSIEPFLYRNGQFIDLNAAAGLPPGSIRAVKKITSGGAIVVSMDVPIVYAPYHALTDYVLVPAAPAPPTGLTSWVVGRVVGLQWLPAPGATDYIVEAGSSPGAGDFFNGSVGAVTAVAAAVPPGRYYVRLRARNADGVSAPSPDIIIDVP